MRRPDYDRYREDLSIALDDGILTLSLNNPDNMNANTEPMHWALSRIWDDIDADPDVSVVIFTGAGDRAFSAGGDPKHMERTIGDASHWLKVSGEAKRIMYGMLACNKPVIARLNGHAVGFGATLALASDLIVGVEGARFGDPHCKIGLVCGDGGALLWAQQIGYARAREFLFTGRLVKMEEAAEIGLINYAVPREELDDKVMELAREIAGGAGRALQLTKAVLNLPLRQAALATMDLGMANEMLSSQSEDHREAVSAMIEKRDPKFTGR
ncbi:MAG: enoyl-CoA hydratase/isomerase family protein [bacterium]|nr:enoyl-CoA hydratase [Deltaproteobacteria bacterium]MCP4907419.1 enoyl-CoA hydratase/isomerase family protein [bacterium]